MHLAILNTQTDTSDFAHGHPDDGQKFASLLRTVRPAWQFDIFAVMNDEFPDDIAFYDGVIISGSIASVHDRDGWISRLEQEIRDMHRRQQPVFGACFGHQVIATALGGAVVRNPGGWSFGIAEVDIVDPQPWMVPPHPTARLFTAHIEQISDLPADSTVIASNSNTPVAGFAIGGHIATIQYHPEISHGFFAGLIDLLADDLPAEIIQHAAETLDQSTDSPVFAEWMARFFETAQDRRSGYGDRT